MWTQEKIKHVDNVIKRIVYSRDKDELAEGLFQVEDDTGYEVEFIYDIFTEAAYDEELTRDEARDPEKILPIWTDVITTAYEYDY